jgi:hypothetical protein
MLKVKILSGIITVTLVLLLAAGCSSPDEPVTTEPDFTGFITDITTIGNNDVVGSIAAESHADKIVDKYVITVRDSTSLFRQDGDKYTEISFDDLEKRQTVRVWFDGPVMESFPMQATALQIVVVP